MILVINFNNMTEITTQGIINFIQQTQTMKSKLNLELLNKKEQLKNLPLFIEIQDLETSIKELDKQEEQAKEQGKQIMIESWLKKFEWLDWTIVQLNKKPWALVIENETLIPKEYFKEKTTVSIDKTTLKKDISEWLIVEWCYISEDYSLVIKNS